MQVPVEQPARKEYPRPTSAPAAVNSVGRIHVFNLSFIRRKPPVLSSRYGIRRSQNGQQFFYEFVSLYLLLLHYVSDKVTNDRNKKTAAGNFCHPGSLFFEADNIIRRTANGAAQLLRREQCDVPLATARGPLLIRADLLFSRQDTAGYL